jgi:hypothetical protein
MYAPEAQVIDPITVMRAAFAPVTAVMRSITDLTDVAYFPKVPFDAARNPSVTALIPANAGDRTSTELHESNASSIRRSDAWTINAMAAIEAAKRTATAGDCALIDTAETLIPHFAILPASLRPQLVFNDEGQPVFAASRSGYYLDISIDSADKITWYAVVDEREFFAEGVLYTGRQLPTNLRVVFEMQRSGS